VSAETDGRLVALSLVCDEAMLDGLGRRASFDRLTDGLESGHPPAAALGARIARWDHTAALMGSGEVRIDRRGRVASLLAAPGARWVFDPI
jgi:hypothetical protein